jgi:hypothetical protein
MDFDGQMMSHGEHVPANASRWVKDFPAKVKKLLEEVFNEQKRPVVVYDILKTSFHVCVGWRSQGTALAHHSINLFRLE